MVVCNIKTCGSTNVITEVEHDKVIYKCLDCGSTIEIEIKRSTRKKNKHYY